MTKSKKKFRVPEEPKPQLVKPNGERRMPKSDVDKFLEELEALETRRNEAIQSLIAERDSAMAEYDEKLRRLGYKGDVVASRPRAAEGKKREAKVGTPCGVCKFATDPYHDGRLKAHRDQTGGKKPFTDEELKKQGFKKVATTEAAVA